MGPLPQNVVRAVASRFARQGQSFTLPLSLHNDVFSRRYVRCDEGPNNKKLSAIRAIHMHKLAYSRLQGAWLPSESQPDLT